MKILESEALKKREQPSVAPVENSEPSAEEVIEEFVEEKPDTWVIAVGELWFKLLCPFTLVESREDAAVLTADVARAQAHRITRIKKMACTIEEA